MSRKKITPEGPFKCPACGSRDVRQDRDCAWECGDCEADIITAHVPMKFKRVDEVKWTGCLEWRIEDQEG